MVLSRAAATNTHEIPLRLTALLAALGVTLPPRRTKLVRHQDHRYDTAKLLAAGQLELYQDNQGKPVFQKCDSILAFTAAGGRHSEFLGLYHILGVEHDTTRAWPAHFLYRERRPGAYWYRTELDPRLRPLAQRLIIDWGGATRSWHQWMDADNDKVVVEIKAPGRLFAFPGYDELVLSYSDLCRVTASPASNPDWHHALSKVSGVYLIQDVPSGELYVGSAYGMQGIWGRWCAYAESCHGGNLRLRDLHQRNPDCHHGFRFSILKTLPLSADKDDVIAYENVWKQKLGSRAHGLNAN